MADSLPGATVATRTALAQGTAVQRLALVILTNPFPRLVLQIRVVKDTAESGRAPSWSRQCSW